MKLLVFGLTISSSWGNGHATLLRGLFRSLAQRGHNIAFFERDVTYYAQHRDFIAIPGVDLHLYSEWEDVWRKAEAMLGETDVAMVTSYCPDGAAATRLILNSVAALRVFYDLDTPVTLETIEKGETVPYLNDNSLADFDVVLSYTGGKALFELQSRLGAKRVFPLYGSVDPDLHRPVCTLSGFASDCSYLGTYAFDRQKQLESLFINAARRMPTQKFIIGGSKYPEDFPWLGNIWYVQHVAPDKHAAFYCSSPVTLNITRTAMARLGYCPSGRLFEAAACGTAIISDEWEGLDQFFEPGHELLVTRDTQEVIDALSTSRAELARIGSSARARALASHTASHRAREFEEIVENSFATPPNRVENQLNFSPMEI
jgi:spore maturation protein CgeB